MPRFRDGRLAENCGVDSFSLRGDAGKVDFEDGTVSWSDTLEVAVSIDDLSMTPIPTVISSMAPETGNRNRASAGTGVDMGCCNSTAVDTSHLTQADLATRSELASEPCGWQALISF